MNYPTTDRMVTTKNTKEIKFGQHVQKMESLYVVGGIVNYEK